ncbi:ATP-binding protein [Patulibacter minatonensis]|uniref:ATP-binding protein n=1 Tax=Patulibacter minatonensis TaxID=298163 RepID=UPI00047B47AC|nr:ATP-binding protein [Patulibacter minatonensis]
MNATGSGPASRRDSLTTPIVTASAAIAVLLAAIVVTMTLAVGNLRDAGRDSSRSENTIVLVTTAERYVVDMQTSLRGFLATGDDTFLEPLRAADLALPRLLRDLDRQVTDPSQRRQLEVITRTITEFRKRIVAFVETARKDLPAARRTVAATKGGGTVAELRTRFARFMTGEDERAAATRQEADDAGRRGILLGVAGATASVLAVLLFALFLHRRVVRPVKRLAAAVPQLGRGDLQVEVPEYGGELGLLAGDFNAMARRLQEQTDEVEGQTAEVEAQRNDLEGTYEALTDEKAWSDRLLRFVEQLVAEAGVEAVSERTVLAILDLAGADAGAVWLVDTEGTLRPAAAVGVAHDHEVTCRAPEIEVLRTAASDRRPVALAGADTCIEVPGFAGPVPASHELHLPLHAGDDLLGGVVVGRVADAPFRADETRRARGMVEQATVALVRALEVVRVAHLGAANASILEAATFGVVLFDPDGSIALMNASLRRMWEALGIDPDSDDRDARARRFIELAVDRQQMEADVRAAVGDPLLRFRFELHDPGADRWFRAITVPVFDDVRTYIGRMVTIEETTEQREVQRLRDEFTATVTHELRTPLSAVVAAVDLLSDEYDEPTPGQQHWGGVIRRNADRLLRLVDDLLTVARAESGQFSLTAEDCDLAVVAGDAVVSARAAAAPAGVTVELVAEPSPARADVTRIAQACDNLLSNAVKFTPSGGLIRLTIGPCTTGGVRIEVADSGSGIPQAERERLFDRFYRTTGATRAAVPGTGLGLTITQAIVVAHGGTIRVEDGIDGGTAFVIELPAGGPPGDD